MQLIKLIKTVFMFVLVEPFKEADLIDRPDLGCAMLIASCISSGHETFLIETQVNYLKSIYVDEIDQTINIIKMASKDTLYELGLNNLNKYKESSCHDLRHKLRELYEFVMEKKGHTRYVHSSLLNEFILFFNGK